MVSVFTIPAWRGFVDDLAAGLLDRHRDPMALARLLVLLPTRRSVLALRDAFVRQSDGAALLLPRMAPVGDLDADEMPGGFAAGAELELPPALPPLARRLTLARLLKDRGNRTATDALMIAGRLGRALDQLVSEGKGPDELRRAAPDAELQEHWAINREMLALVLEAWPALLAERGRMDPIMRSNAMLDRIARDWAQSPPPGGVVLAGLSQAAPAVARLARSIAGMPGGMVVLPGLDADLTAAQWALIRGDEDAPARETHPMWGLARLLAAIDVPPEAVAPWPHRAVDAVASPPERGSRVATALAPGGPVAHAIDRPVALAGVRMIEAANPAEEALLIAVALRQVVERPGRTAALVTPDRALARRVTVQLGRFGITLNDSAGHPLALSGPGGLLVALADAMGERFAPVPLLALLGHPLVRAGDARIDWLDRVRLLDRLALRGLRPAPGVDGVGGRLRLLVPDEPALAPVVPWWDAEVRPMLERLPTGAAPADAVVDALLETAEALAGEQLWAGDAGRVLRTLVEELDDSRAELAGIRLDPVEAAPFVAQLMADCMVRPVWRRHPQLEIWGPLEARLQRADLIVLAGLNEGVWPQRPAPDPFLAPAIRRRMAMPGVPARIGLQAHDMLMALGAPEVLLTRAARDGKAPAVASRFWQGIASIAGEPLPDDGRLTPPRALLRAAVAQIDRAERTRACPRPAPAPPPAERPRRIRVTEVATLKADPFSFYARHMLRLEPLDPIDAEPTAADRGTAVHRILERWFGSPVEPDLEAMVAEELARLGERPELDAMWRPRVMRMLEHARERHGAEPHWTDVRVEAAGRLERNGVLLVGKADRLDRGPDGYRVIDYKTGKPPPLKKVNALFDTQLALLAAMLEAGAFPDVPPGPVASLRYWQLTGGKTAGKEQRVPGANATPDHVRAHMVAALDAFDTLAAEYLLGGRPFEAKTHMRFGGGFGDYDLLARVAEWQGR